VIFCIDNANVNARVNVNHHVPAVKPEAAIAVVVASDDGHEDALNMLSL
jgi:hypothetical protein